MPKRIAGASDEWRTPKDLWDNLNLQYQFEVDLCASPENAKCKDYVTSLADHHAKMIFSDDEERRRMAWINPPFSKARALLPLAFGAHDRLIGIYRCDNLEAPVWQEVILYYADWVLFLKGRVRYEDPAGQGRVSPMFGSALFGQGVNPPPIWNGQLWDLTCRRA